MTPRFFPPRPISPFALALTLLGCQQGGQSGDLNHDALDSKDNEATDDTPSEPEPGPSSSEDAGGEPRPDNDEPEPPRVDDDEPEPTDSGALSSDEPEPAAAVPPAPSDAPPFPNPTPQPTAVPTTPTPALPPDPPPLVDSGAPDGQCSNIDYDSLTLDGDALGFEGVNAVGFYGDGRTTLCVEPSPGRLCISGVAPDSGPDYVYWGSGFALVVEASENEPRDLESLGVTAVGVDISDVTGRPVRLAMTEVDDPAIADVSQNFAQNPFVFGGSSPNSTTTEANIIVAFSQFEQPSWTSLVDPATGLLAEGLVVDGSRLKAFHLQITNAPSDPTTTYGFCVGNVAWYAADGRRVTLPVPPPADAGAPLD